MRIHALVTDLPRVWHDPRTPARDRASVPYLDRSRVRRGMVTPVVVQAFASIGWGWGGDWDGAKDYQHFSGNGR